MTDDPSHRDDGTTIRIPVTDFERPVHALLGLPFDETTVSGAVRRLRDAARTRTRCFLSTPNLNFVVACLDDPAFRGSVLRSDLSVPDGMPLIWAARAMRIPLRERVTGAGLFEALRVPDADRRSDPMRVYFFGGPEGHAALADAALRDGGLVGVGHCAPGFGTIDEMSTSSTIEAINASRADFLVVALGARKGQRWIEHNLAALDVPLVSHLGAVVNFAAGRTRRAPVAWQRVGLEWAWRIVEEPALWRRYLSDGLVYLRLLLTCVLPGAIEARRHRPGDTTPSSSVVSTTRVGDTTVVALEGAWTAANLAPLRRALQTCTTTPGPIEVDVTRVPFVDSALIGLLMLAAGHQSKVGHAWRIAGATRAFRRRLAHHGARWLLRA